MPLRVNAKQLRELVEEIESNGGDASVLRQELEQLEPEVRRESPRRGLRVEAEELTTEERLNNRVGDLFPNGIPFKEIFDYDYRFSQKELIKQCREMGLSLSGDKKEMAAKIIAHNSGSTKEQGYLGEGI